MNLRLRDSGSTVSVGVTGTKIAIEAIPPLSTGQPYRGFAGEGKVMHVAINNRAPEA